MPELILTCGEKRYTCKSITVDMYRKYTEIMQRNTEETIESALEANTRILAIVFDVGESDIEAAGIEEILTVAKEIHFLMQDVIAMKFLDLNPEHPELVEKEKSAFDEYDEENGYNDEPESGEVWKILRENMDRVVKLCIDVLKNSYQQCMEADIISLLDHMAFQVRATDH